MSIGESITEEKLRLRQQADESYKRFLAAGKTPKQLPPLTYSVHLYWVSKGDGDDCEVVLKRHRGLPPTLKEAKQQWKGGKVLV